MEFMRNRKGFTLSMIQNRWDKCRDEVLELLQRYQVPGHLNNQDASCLTQGLSPADVAIFFEEYIFGIEKKEKLSHSKLKPKKVCEMRNH